MLLWAMRVIKLDQWYRRHWECGEWQRYRLPPDVVHAFRFGDEAARLAEWEQLSRRERDRVIGVTGWVPAAEIPF